MAAGEENRSTLFSLLMTRDQQCSVDAGIMVEYLREHYDGHE
jgi:hypothetical protein